MEKDQKDMRNQNHTGTGNKAGNQKEHGVISVVQSPDEEKTKSGIKTQYGKKDEPSNQNKSGVPSHRKSPDEEGNKKQPMPKNPTMDRDKQQGTQQHSKDWNNANSQARVANVDAPEDVISDDTGEGDLYDDGTSQGMEDDTMNEKTRKDGM
jgi:hypothetical protein